jgi:hypothetical protein
MRTIGRGWCLFVTAAVAAALTAGCSPDDSLNSPAAKKLAAVGTMYLDYVASERVAPPNERAFKRHIQTRQENVLQHNGIDPKNVDATFLSERDNEPFVVLYGQGVGTLSGDSTQVVAHEKAGKNGKKLVVLLSTKLRHVTDAELEELKAPKDKS